MKKSVIISFIWEQLDRLEREYVKIMADLVKVSRTEGLTVDDYELRGDVLQMLGRLGTIYDLYSPMYKYMSPKESSAVYKSINTLERYIFNLLGHIEAGDLYEGFEPARAFPTKFNPDEIDFNNDEYIITLGGAHND